MNRKNCAGVRKKLLLLPARSHFHGSKPTRPIIAVHHVRRITQPSQQSDPCATKKREPLEVVYFAINLAAIEIERCVDQIRGRVQCFALPDTDDWTFAAPLNFNIFYEGAAQQTTVNLSVEWGDKEGINAFGVQSLSQRSGNIGEAAGLSEGNCFG